MLKLKTIFELQNDNLEFFSSNLPLRFILIILLYEKKLNESTLQICEIEKLVSRLTLFSKKNL